MNSPEEQDGARCPECNQPWSETGACPNCMLERAEAERFRSAAFAHARNAYAQLRSGDIPGASAELQTARTLGIPAATVARLSSLIAALTGEWGTLNPENLPEGWRNAVQPESGAADRYREAQEAATREDWAPALAAAEACLALAPWFVPAHKMRILALVGLERTSEALTACEELLEELPAEPGLLRYYRELAPLAVPPPPPVVDTPPPPPVETPEPPRPEPPAPAPKGVPLWTWGAIAGAALVSFVLGRSQTPAVVATPTPMASVAATPTVSATPTEAAPTSTPSPTVAATPAPLPSPTPAVASESKGEPAAGKVLPPRIAREEKEYLAERDLQLARRWFNRAVVARKQGRAKEALQLAEASQHYATGTYLEVEALLLRAQAAEAAGEGSAAELYDAVADRFPNSGYAGVSRKAAQRLRNRKAPGQ